MLGARKKLKEKEKEKAESEAAESAASGGAASGGGGGATVSITGVAGAGTGRGGTGKRHLSPGEIRVRSDIDELDAGDVAEVSWPDPSNLMKMSVIVTPDNGLWKGGKYEFEVEVPKMYPHEPPKVRCATPIYHPNIDAMGAVCLNILRKEWRPVFDLNTVIYGMIFLFHEPNANDPLNHEAAKQLRDNEGEFRRTVAQTLRGAAVGGRRYPKFK